MRTHRFFVDSQMSPGREGEYVSRAGIKLAHALRAFDISPRGWICADLGSSTGGFVDCLLQHGAARVYAVERGYGVLDHRLRTDARVAVMERTDALHVRLRQPVQLVTIDAGWTRQRRILPAALGLLADGGHIVTLVKPQYEADAALVKRGVLPDAHLPATLEAARRGLSDFGLRLEAETESCIKGHAGNREWLWHLRPE